MSHEEPDLEVPDRAKLEPALQQTGAAVPGGVQELRGEITWQVVVSGLLVAVIMGTAYPYMVMKLGFGPNVSVVAAFFGFLFLRVIDLALRARHYNRWQNNLAEAAGTSAAQTAFMCILLGAFDILRSISAGKFQMELSPLTSFLWLTSAATLGVLLAVPLRRHFIVDEKLPYVDGLAAAETITVLDPPRGASPEVRRNAMRAFYAVISGVIVAGGLMMLREDAKLTSVVPEAFMLPWYVFSETKQRVAEAGGAVAAAAAAPVVTGALLANLNVGMSFSLLNIGSGMIIGLRINVSMMIGGTIGWIIAPYFLVKYGMLTNPETGQVIDTPSYRQVLFWVMWPATGMLVAGGLTSLALRWRLLASTFRSLRGARIDSSEFPLSIVVPGIGVSALTLCIVQNQLLGMPVWVTLTAIVLSLPLMLVGLRVLGETNWGPISSLSNMMQGVFAGIAPGNVAANMVASGTTGTIATSSEMIMQDYRCAQIVGTRPRLITIMQLLAVPVGAAAVSLIYPVLVDAYRIIDGVDAAGAPIKAGLPAPISQKWAGFAKILQDGPSALPASALYALVVASLLGVVLTVLESRPRLKKYVPSPTGLGIAVLVPFAYIFTMFVGAVIGALWTKLDRRSSELYLVPLGSGFIAGEALIAVIAAIIIGITSA